MTAQISLFDAQAENLQRVRGRIGPSVLTFCRAHMGQTFYMRDLEEYVRARVPGAPDSPSRILRILRQDGLLSYEVVNRAQSLYRVLPVDISRAGNGASMTPPRPRLEEYSPGEESREGGVPLG